MANGLIPELSNVRNFDYITTTASLLNMSKQETEKMITNNTYPKTFQLNFDEMGAEIKDQGSVGACVACTTTLVYEALYKQMYGESKAFSEGWTFGATRESRVTNSGMLLQKTLDLQTQKGFLPKFYFDVLIEMPDMYDACNKFPNYFEIAQKYRLGGYSQIDSRLSVRDNQIKDALTRYRVPLVSVCPKNFGEYHCITLVGWDDSTDTYILKNSWGNQNGKKGLVSVPKKAISDIYVLYAEKIALPFEDVSPDDWFYNGVREVFMSGLMNGKSATEFKPQDTLTRAEFAVALSRLMKKIDDNNKNVIDLIDLKAHYKRLGDKFSDLGD